MGGSNLRELQKTNLEGEALIGAKKLDQVRKGAHLDGIHLEMLSEARSMFVR